MTYFEIIIAILLFFLVLRATTCLVALTKKTELEIELLNQRLNPIQTIDRDLGGRDD